MFSTSAMWPFRNMQRIFAGKSTEIPRMTLELASKCPALPHLGGEGVERSLTRAHPFYVSPVVTGVHTGVHTGVVTTLRTVSTPSNDRRSLVFIDVSMR
jgi:hypothetical protein